MENIGNSLKTLKEKNKNKTKTPIQKVVPIKQSINIDEKVFSLHLPKSMLKELKKLSADREKSMKQLIQEAIKEKYKI